MYKDYSGSKSFPARLQELCSAWQKLAEPTLNHRKKMLTSVASGYFTAGYSKEHIVNLMDRGISTLVPFLVEGNPRILVETAIANYRPWAFTTQLALNFFIDKLDLANNVLIPAAMNSMVGAAITRTSLYYDRRINLEDEQVKIGTPWVELIDDSQYIGDPSAKRRADFSFEGDSYVLPTAYAQEFFSGKDKHGNQIADYIKPSAKLAGDFNPKEISAPNFDRTKLSLRDYTRFIDVYLKDEGTIVTFLPKGEKAKILREVEYEGPGDGPYDYLGYKWFPDSPLPIPPAWSWYDLDATLNVLIQKMREQAESQKDIVAFSDEAGEDMSKILDTPNMGTVRVSDVGAMKALSFGGVNPLNWEWVNWAEAQHSKQGANPDVLGGRGASAPTLGQEQMVYNNATRVVNNMYTRFMDFTTSILKKLAWAFWTDPTVYVPVVKEIPGVAQLPEVFSSKERVGDFYDFIFKIAPYSTQRMSPEIQYQKIMMLMTQWVLPTLDLAAQQGATLDVPTATRVLAEYVGVDSFNQYYKTAVPHELSAVPYKMQPNGRQASDAFGTTIGNQNENLNQQQGREGAGTDTFGAETK